MSRDLQSSDKNKFSVVSFVEACRNTNFHHRWMTAETWVNLILHRYMLSADERFSGKNLSKALSLRSSLWLTGMMDINTNNAPHDHIDIFRISYKPKNSMIHCYYATPNGSNPIKAETKWYLDIRDSNDLLNQKVTRSSNLRNATNAILSMTVPSSWKKRKHDEPSSSIALTTREIVMYELHCIQRS